LGRADEEVLSSAPGALPCRELPALDHRSNGRAYHSPDLFAWIRLNFDPVRFIHPKAVGSFNRRATVLQSLNHALHHPGQLLLLLATCTATLHGRRRLV